MQDIQSLDALNLVRVIYSNPLVKAVLGLMAANILLGIAVAFQKKEFALAELGDWLLTRAIPYLLGAGAVQLVVLTVPGEYLAGLSPAISTAVWGFCIAALMGHIFGDLKDLGLPVAVGLTTKDHVTDEKLKQLQVRAVRERRRDNEVIRTDPYDPV